MLTTVSSGSLNDYSKVWGWYDFSLRLNEVSYAYLIKNLQKTVILWNIITICNNNFVF